MKVSKGYIAIAPIPDRENWERVTLIPLLHDHSPGS